MDDELQKQKLTANYEAVKKYRLTDKYKIADKKRRQTKEYLEQYCSKQHSRKILNSKSVAKYRQTEKGRLAIRTYTHNRRVRLGKRLTKKELQQIYDGNIIKHSQLTCDICTHPITDVKQWTLEHFIPISRGGTNELSNLGVAHRSCNSSKRDKTLEEYHILRQNNKR